ncbi:18550_t:CDS:1, partial [Entrophospora sp. SA101]
MDGALTSSYLAKIKSAVMPRSFLTVKNVINEIYNELQQVSQQ